MQLSIAGPPAFITGERHETPPLDARLVRVSLSPERAFTLLCDLGHIYIAPQHRPRVGGMLEHDGGVTLYFWPRHVPDSALLILLLDYGAARVADLRCWHGQAWMSGELLDRVLAALSARSAERRFWEVAA